MKGNAKTAGWPGWEIARAASRCWLLDAGSALRIPSCASGTGSIVEQAAKLDETTVERQRRRWIFAARLRCCIQQQVLIIFQIEKKYIERVDPLSYYSFFSSLPPVIYLFIFKKESTLAGYMQNSCCCIKFRF